MAPADFVQRGRQLCAQAQYQEAVKVCRLGLLAHPTELEGRLVLGGALMALGRHDEVLAEMRVALELDADSPRALTLKGEALLRKGDALQASDILARAVAAAPSDGAIQVLYGEARRVREGGAPSQAPAARGPRPSSMDRPAPLGPPPGARSVASSPDLLAIGDHSGTIEIDPDLEGVEIRYDHPAMPGSGRASHPSDMTEVSEPSIELHTEDLMAPAGLDTVDMLRGPVGQYPGGVEDEQPFEPRSSAAARALPRQDHGHPGYGPEPEYPRAQGPGRGPAGARGADGGGGGPAIDQLFPEDEEGVSQVELDDPPTNAPTTDWQPPDGVSFRGPGRSRDGDMRMIRQGLGLPAEPSSPGRRLPVSAAPGPAPGPAPGGFGGPPPGYGYGPPPAAGPVGARSSAGYPVQRPDARSAGRAARAAGPGASRGGVPLIVYALLALLVVGGAVLAGFKVRDMRLGGQIAKARKNAAAAARRDTYTGYLEAIDALGRIERAKSSAETRAVQAEVAARMAAEMGEGVDRAEKLVGGLDKDNQMPAALAARGFLALAHGDVKAAREAVEALRKAAPKDPNAAYLEGRAALLEGQPGQAVEALDQAATQAHRPGILVTLARAQAAEGHYDEALAALKQAGGLSPRHPGVVIWTARIEAMSGALPDPPQPEAGLQTVLADARKPPDRQAVGVSPGQAAWASLALAEVKLARGDRAAARTALEAAKAATAPHDAGFRAALVELLVGTGQLAEARAEVAAAAREQPTSAAVRVLEASVDLATGDAAGALEALDKAGDIDKNPRALAIRGRARLMAGKLDQAAADLDAALALEPGLDQAVMARAQVDLSRGEARAAQKRLKSLYGDGSTAAVEVVAAYAQALRMSGNLDKAGAVLDALDQGRKADARTAPILLERARLQRAGGAYDQAARTYETAIEAAPRTFDARLEAATLSIDRGDTAAALSALDALVAEAGQSGPVLVAAARAHTLTGDHPGAAELLDRADKVTAPGALLARERGRLFLRQRLVPKAVSELDRAKSLDPADPETRLLLMQAFLLGKDKKGAARELEDVTKTFRGSWVVSMARGIEALVREKPRDAGEELIKAHALIAASKGSPREIGRADYWVGRAMYLSADLPRAKDWLEKALARDPSLPDAQYLLGQIAFESGQEGRMIDRFEKSVALDSSGNPAAWYFLGEKYADEKKFAEARKALETYTGRWPKGDFAADARDLLKKLPN